MSARMVRLRERVAGRLPTVLTNYPFEVIVTFIALVIGLPLLCGLVAPTSLVVLLPSIGYWAYAAALVLGGIFTGVGLRLKSSAALSSGLQLLGGSYAVYGLATVALSGFATAWLAFGAFFGLGLVALVRALHFRRLLDIQEGATRLAERSRE